MDASATPCSSTKCQRQGDELMNLSSDDHARRIREFTAGYAVSHASAYTSTTRSGYFYLRRQALVSIELARLTLKGDLLDVGCGTGHASAVARTHGFRYEGVDLSPEMIGEARRANPGTGFTEGSIEQLPHGSRMFDVVLALGVLEYVRTDRLSVAMSEISRVLKPGGTLLASLLNRRSPVWMYRGVREGVSATRSLVLHRPVAPASPEHLFTRADARKLVNSAGLVHQRTTSYAFAIIPEREFARHPETWARIVAPLERRGGGPSAHLGMAHLVVAHRPRDDASA